MFIKKEDFLKDLRKLHQDGDTLVDIKHLSDEELTERYIRCGFCNNNFDEYHIHINENGSLMCRLCWHKSLLGIK